MLFGLLCLLILCATLLVLRKRTSVSGAAPAWQAPRSRPETAAALLLLLASCYPILRLGPWSEPHVSVLLGDAASHARVGGEVARYGLPHGWLESYLGGFPFGHHYPPLGWLLLAGGMKLGLSPGLAVNGLGLLATLAAPWAVYAACARAGARPLIAACAGSLLALVSPYNPFVGGFEVYFSTGLLSQALALPLCISSAAAIARGARAEATIFAALSMSAHPQLSAACFVLVALVALVDGARGRRASVACALGAALLTGGALYGQGLRTLQVPFGWPPGFGWRQVGFGTSRLMWWFRDGDLLDNGSHVPVLTALAGAAGLVSALLLSRRASRALLLATLAGLTLSSTGPALLQLPRWGPWLLEFAQPLRALCLLAPLLAVLLAVSLEEGTGALVRVALPERAWLARVMPFAAPALCLCVLALALPGRVRAAEELSDARREATCHAAVPGFERARLSAWVRALRGGSLWFDSGESQQLGGCVMAQGVELESAVSLGNTGAVGAHVGILAAAARQLQPERDGAARRAEALGVRYVLRDRREQAGLAAGFQRRAESGAIELLELPGVRRARLGCVRERWSGSDRALRARLVRDLSTTSGADHLLDPERFVELVPGPGDLKVEPVDAACDTRGATLEIVEHEPGLLEAVIENPAPVDVAFNAAAFPAWRVSIDGGPEATTRTIAPGYVYVPLAAGRHRVLVEAGTLPGYGVWLFLAAVGVAALAWLDARKLPAAWRSLGRR